MIVRIGRSQLDRPAEVGPRYAAAMVIAGAPVFRKPVLPEVHGREGNLEVRGRSESSIANGRRLGDGR